LVCKKKELVKSALSYGVDLLDKVERRLLQAITLNFKEGMH